MSIPLDWETDTHVYVDFYYHKWFVDKDTPNIIQQIFELTDEQLRECINLSFIHLLEDSIFSDSRVKQGKIDRVSDTLSTFDKIGSYNSLTQFIKFHQQCKIKLTLPNTKKTLKVINWLKFHSFNNILKQLEGFLPVDM